MKNISLLFLVMTLYACGQSVEQKPADQPAAAPKYQPKTTWTEKDLEFQQSYCLQIMAKIEQLDKESYCNCFLGKVKFYYEPIDVLHAYRQEKDFSKECMDLHYSGETGGEE